MLLATTQVEDLDRFMAVFTTAGADKRKQHGSEGATVFRDPTEEDRVWVIFDWDAEGWQSFVSDPEVPPIMKEAGHKGKPQAGGSSSATATPDRRARTAQGTPATRRAFRAATRDDGTSSPPGRNGSAPTPDQHAALADRDRARARNAERDARQRAAVARAQHLQVAAGGGREQQPAGDGRRGEGQAAEVAPPAHPAALGGRGSPPPRRPGPRRWRGRGSGRRRRRSGRPRARWWDRPCRRPTGSPG